MIVILRCIVILALLLSICNADTNGTIENESSYIDEIHKIISETVIEWSEVIDATVSNWLEKNETNITVIEANTTALETNRTALETNETVDANIIAFAANTTVESIKANTATNETNIPSVTTNAAVVKTNTPIVKTNTPIVKTSTAVVKTNTAANTIEEKVQSVDQFFQNDKYLNETEDTYIRVRVESYLQSKESNDFDLTLRAQMPFSKSKKNLKIFVDNLTVDNADDILKDSSEDDHVTPDIGVHYFAPERKIKSRYSIGLSGIDPFVQARYNIPIKIDEWLIDPVQIFKYSTDDKFEEETNIYFDRKVGEKSLLRIQLHRSTQEKIDGMDYALSAQYYRSTKKDTGFGFGQTFIGNTKYQYIVDNSVEPPQTKTYGGIHNYVTSFSWRENIWRKWFYYEVRPSVSFHKQYDYKPNYRIRLFFDFYFGKFN